MRFSNEDVIVADDNSPNKLSRKLSLIDEDEIDSLQPMTTRTSKVKSLQKFRSDRAKNKFGLYKRQKQKNMLPNLRPGNDNQNLKT